MTLDHAARFVGRAVLVTGSTGGIGQALVHRFYAEGAKLVLVDLDADAAQQQAHHLDGRALACTCDVSKEEETAAAFDAVLQRFGRTDVAALNAGIEGRVVDLENRSASEFDYVINVNLRDVFLRMTRLMRTMKEQNGGMITVASSSGGLRGSLGMGPYVASKHAVIGLVKCAALEGTDRNVRVNAVSHGAIDTRMLRALGDSGADAEHVHHQRKGGIPLKRYGTPEEVAALVAFLSCHESGLLHRRHLPGRWRCPGRAQSLKRTAFIHLPHPGVLF